ncbi:MAG: phospholipase D family protein [Halieaceae bacterium]
MAEEIAAEHGQEHSGFHLLDGSAEGLTWRLALIDSAVSSIDVQTYLWYPDNSGRLMLERVVHAANRGVKVRLIVDDLLLQGHDQLVANLQAQPNIEFRLFNPWQDRDSLVSRAGEMIAQMERLNTRMHDKLLIVDGRAAIIGGRNIGDHYFGLSSAYNFHDTDLMGIGHIALQSNDMFDQFWNSKWVLSALNLTTEPDQEIAQQQWQNLQNNSKRAPELAAFARKPKSWETELSELKPDLRMGTSALVYDEAGEQNIQQKVLSSMFNFFQLAQEELLIMNAYVIPAQEGVDFLAAKTANGVDVRMLTNSLASHDVPAVNSHYEPWRDDFINAGVKLYELRADPEIKAIVDVPPANSAFTGLHSKTAVVDRRYVFVGSMNLDPRSANINTEMGAMVDSPALAEDLAQVIERDMRGENAWAVKINDEGNIYWQNSDETLTRQPARDGMQRVMNTLLKLGPRDQY